MSIKLKFALTLGLLLLALTLTWAALHTLEQREQHRAQIALRTERMNLLHYWLNADAGTFIRMARGLAGDEHTSRLFFSAGSGGPPRDAALSAAPADFTIWLLRADGTLMLSTKRDQPPADALPLARPTFAAHVLQPSGCHFHFAHAGSLYEVCAEPVGTTIPTVGWLLLIRPWDQRMLDQLGALAGARLSVTLPEPSEAPPAGDQPPPQQLRDWQQQPVARLTAEWPLPPDSPLPTGWRSPTPWFILFGLLVISGVGLGLRRWVLTPLDRISSSLATDNPAPLRPLQDDAGELGAVARLVESSFVQREDLKQSEASLRQALEERIRLGRDLHDGVIQALYATGMGLAGIKARLNHDQTDVAAGLEQSRAALNQTILDLRNFITGLEPEALKQQSFGQVVALLLEQACSGRNVQSKCEINEALAERLTISQRANILQITREALSNALRHGAATEISIRLWAIGAEVAFEIRDNGQGFDPETGNGNGGHGLENLAGRAHDIGAQFQLQSRPGHGTHLILTLIPRQKDSA